VVDGWSSTVTASLGLTVHGDDLRRVGDGRQLATATTGAEESGDDAVLGDGNSSGCVTAQ
jgi:hypothetical protein